MSDWLLLSLCGTFCADTSYYPTTVCSGALCPSNALPYVQNTQNNALAPAGAFFATCSGGNVAGCATAVATNIPDISNDPDHTSLLAVGGNLYSVMQFESPTPAQMYMVQLATSVNGDLSVKPGSLTYINMAAYGGMLSLCAGSTTPWCVAAVWL